MIAESLRRAARPLLLLLLLSPAACIRQTVETRPTIPLVREILAGKNDPRAQMLRGFKLQFSLWYSAPAPEAGW